MREPPPTLTIESVSAFNGLDVLVARDEGLFAAEGLDLRIVRPRPSQRTEAAGFSSVDRGTLRQPGSNQGRLLDQHTVDMFQG